MQVPSFCQHWKFFRPLGRKRGGGDGGERGGQCGYVRFAIHTDLCTLIWPSIRNLAILELSQFYAKKEQKHCLPCFSLEMFSSPSAIGKTWCADNLINHSSKFFATCNEIKDGKRLHEKTNKLLYKYLATENSLILRKNNLAKILAEKQGFPTL